VREISRVCYHLARLFFVNSTTFHLKHLSRTSALHFLSQKKVAYMLEGRDQSPAHALSTEERADPTWTPAGGGLLLGAV
jgi:hypothetical protein